MEETKMENPESVNVMTEDTQVHPEKLSYEALENVAHQLSDQSRQLYAENTEMKKLLAMVDRVNYLFKVIEFKDAFDKDFVGKCATEITNFMTIPEKTEEPATDGE